MDMSPKNFGTSKVYEGTYCTNRGEYYVLELEDHSQTKGVFGPIFVPSVAKNLKIFANSIELKKSWSHTGLIKRYDEAFRAFDDFCHHSAKSALDIALTDLRSKLFGVSAASLLGGALRSSFHCYASCITSGTTTNSIRNNKKLSSIDKQKWRLPFSSKDGSSWLRGNAQFLLKLRSQFPNVPLIVELSRSCTVADLKQLIPLFEEYGVREIEDPVKFLLRKAANGFSIGAGISFLGGEDLLSDAHFFQALAEHRYDVYVIEPTWIGGISGAIKRLHAVASSGHVSYLHGCSPVTSTLIASLFDSSVVSHIEYGVTQREDLALKNTPVSLSSCGHLIPRRFTRSGNRASS